MIRVTRFWYVVLGWGFCLGIPVMSGVIFGAPSFEFLAAALFSWLVLPRIGHKIFIVSGD